MGNRSKRKRKRGFEWNEKCVEMNIMLFSAAMDLPPPVTPKSFKEHEVSMPLYSTLLFFPVVFLFNYLYGLS